VFLYLQEAARSVEHLLFADSSAKNKNVTTNNISQQKQVHIIVSFDLLTIIYYSPMFGFRGCIGSFTFVYKELPDPQSTCFPRTV
jgi:hypothetical protein